MMMGWNCARGATLPCPNGARGAAGGGGDAVCPGGAKALLCGAPDFGGFTGKSALRGGLPFRKGWHARREAGKNRFAYSRAFFKGWQTRPEHGGTEAMGASRAAKTARSSRGRLVFATIPRGDRRALPAPAQGTSPLGIPFWGTGPHLPRLPVSPNAAGGKSLLVDLPPSVPSTVPPETQRSIHAPCSWGMDASPPSQRRWPPALPALVEFGALEHVAAEEERQ